MQKNETKKKLVIVGTSTNAEHVYQLVVQYDLYEVLGFAVDRKYLTSDRFLGLPVYPLEEIEQYVDVNETEFFIALLWNRLNADRRDLYNRLKARGLHFANIISPRASIRGRIEGDNCWIHDFVVIQNDAVIGNNVAIMAQSLIGSHVVIGDHCFLGNKSTVGGGSVIGTQTFVGINCTVFDGTTVGDKCILGACTAVKRNVPNYTVVKTSSEIVMKQLSEEEIESKLLFRKNVR